MIQYIKTKPDFTTLAIAFLAGAATAVIASIIILTMTPVQRTKEIEPGDFECLNTELKKPLTECEKETKK